MKLPTFPVTLCLLLTVLPLCSVRADEVYSKTEAANRLYKQGKYEEALKLYEDALLLSPSESSLKMNKGSALYQLGDYENAEKSYEGALSAKEKKSRATAHYNLGNILFRKGETMQRQGDMKAQEAYKGALDHYIQALDLQPSDNDAKWNLQLAHRRIKQMEQQQQQQKNQPDKNNNDNKDNDKNREQQQNNDNRQNKDQQQDQQQQQQDDQNKKENDKKDQQQQQQENQDKKNLQQQQQQQQQAQERNSDDRKKQDAARIIELYADDADSLNKPMKKGVGKQQQPEKDW